MALIDIYTVRDGVSILAFIKTTQVKTLWKCGACKRGNLAQATSWEDIEIRDSCSYCRRKVSFNILGK